MCSQDFLRPFGARRQARPVDDRCDASEGAPDSCQSVKKGAVPRRIGRTKGGLNSKLHAVCDGKGRPLVMLPSEGQMSDYKGAALMLDALLRAKALLGDRGYDADWFRKALGLVTVLCRSPISLCHLGFERERADAAQV
ncbi:transposase [Sphingobium sp. Cam5-1]|nr:transposase [Sphingobium sp. Cam5-1]